MELTKEHFDGVLKTLATKEDLKTLATKEELKTLATQESVDQVATDVGSIKRDLAEVKESVATLSKRTHEDATATLKDVVKLKGRVKNLEKEVEQLKLQQAA